MLTTILGRFLGSWRAWDLSQSEKRPSAHGRWHAEHPGGAPGGSPVLPLSAQPWGHAGSLFLWRVKRLSSCQVHGEGSNARLTCKHLAGDVEPGRRVSGGGNRVGVLRELALEPRSFRPAPLPESQGPLGPSAPGSSPACKQMPPAVLPGPQRLPTWSP